MTAIIFFNFSIEIFHHNKSFKILFRITKTSLMISLKRKLHLKKLSLLVTKNIVNSMYKKRLLKIILYTLNTSLKFKRYQHK